MSGVIGRKATHIIFDMDALLNKRKTVKGEKEEPRREERMVQRYVITTVL